MAELAVSVEIPEGFLDEVLDQAESVARDTAESVARDVAVSASWEVFEEATSTGSLNDAPGIREAVFDAFEEIVLAALRWDDAEDASVSKAINELLVALRLAR